MQSCDLEEYNPSGATSDVLLFTPDGVATFVNRLYYNYPWKYFGREDPVLYIESSTDIWVPPRLRSTSCHRTSTTPYRATITENAMGFTPVPTGSTCFSPSTHRQAIRFLSLSKSNPAA